MKTHAVNYAIFAFAILILCCFETPAQNDTCNLQIRVYEFKEDGSAEQFPVKDVKTKLVDAKTGRSLKVSEKDGSPFVTSVGKGEYFATFSKKGFKNTSEKLYLGCESADFVNEEIVFLWRGNSKETVKAYFEQSLGDAFAVKEDKKETFEAEKNKPVVGTVNSSAVLLARPAYPKAARAVRATGDVEVQVTINELGYVISAEAISGHPLLRMEAVQAAKKSKFAQTILQGFPVKVIGIIVYKFVP